MRLPRLGVMLSVLVISACGGPITDAEPLQSESVPVAAEVEQKSDPEGPGETYGYHRTYYSDSSETTVVGAWSWFCNGEERSWGAETAWYDETRYVCS